MEFLITVCVVVTLWSTAGIACFFVAVCMFKRQWDALPGWARGLLGIAWGPGTWALAIIGNAINARRIASPPPPPPLPAASDADRLHRMLARIVTEAETGNSDLREETYGDACQLLREIDQKTTATK